MFVLLKVNTNQVSIVFPKDNHSSLNEHVSIYLRNAGYKTLTLLQEKIIPLSLQGRDLVVETGKGEGRTGALLLPLLMQLQRDSSGIKAIILTNSSHEVTKVARQYKRFSGHTHRHALLSALGCEDNIKKDLRLLSSKPDIAVATSERLIDHIRRNNISLQNVRYSILDINEENESSGFYKDLLFIYSKLPSKLQTIVLSPRILKTETLDTILKRPQFINRDDWCQVNGNKSLPEASEEEKTKMKNGTKGPNISQDFLKSELQKIREIITGQENPEILNEYRKIFRRNVPLHLRAYISAYLLKEYFAERGDKGNDKDGTSTLFVSIGKTRKVYPRDLSQLFSEALKLPTASIGGIKVLDNYSFIEIPDSEAERAIELLNNSDYRGRKITVNHARKKS
jgi:hypothetical protein